MPTDAFGQFLGYMVLATIGIFVAVTIRRLLLAHIPSYGETLFILIVWVLLVVYIRMTLARPYLDYASEAAQQRQIWMIIIAYIICGIGLPLFIPRVVAFFRGWLSTGSVQWLLTFVFAVVSYLILTVAQGFGDYLIRAFLQTNPEQFPGAQRALTAMLGFVFWLAGACVILLVVLFASGARTGLRRKLSELTGATVSIFALVVAVEFMFRYQPFALDFEDIIILSSFTPNSVKQSGADNRLIC